MKELILYRCEYCGNLISMIVDSGVTPECCGEQMQRVAANSQDAAVEKHVPVITRQGGNIRIAVGATEHPMKDDHYIEWIVMLTEHGVYSRYLQSGDAPEADFCVAEDETVQAAYAYCNLHGLWVMHLER